MDGSDCWMLHHPTHAVLGKGDDNNYKEKSKNLSAQFYISFAALLSVSSPLNSAMWRQRWMIASFSCALMDSCKRDWN